MQQYCCRWMCILNDSSMRLKLENRLKAQELLWDKIVRGDQNKGKMVKVSGKSTNASMCVCDLTAVSALIWWIASCIYGGYCVQIMHIRHWLFWLAVLAGWFGSSFEHVLQKALFDGTFLHTSIPNLFMQFLRCLKFETIIWYSKILIKRQWCRLTFNSCNILFMRSIFTNFIIKTSNDSGYVIRIGYVISISFRFIGVRLCLLSIFFSLTDNSDQVFESFNNISIKSNK